MFTIAHHWSDVVFLHWRTDPATLSGLLPARTRPDIVDGSAWIGVTAYRFDRTTVPPLPFPGRLGAMTQITVEVPTTDRSGHHAVTFLTVETQHVPGIAAARAGIGAPYRFARMGVRRSSEHLAYRSRRTAGRSSVRVGTGDGDGRTIDARVDVVPDRSVAPVALGPGPLLAHRDGIHVSHLGRTTWWRRTHAPWTLRPAELVDLGGTLPRTLGLPDLFDRRPDSAVVGDRTDVTYSWGGTL